MKPPPTAVLPLFPTVRPAGPAPGLPGRSPSIDIIGSYFPAWIACFFVGLALTLFIRLLLVGLRLDAWVGPKAIFYPCLLLICSLITWLVVYNR